MIEAPSLQEGVLTPKYQSTKVPKYQSTKVPKYQSTKVPKYQSTKVPKYKSTKVPKYQSTKVLSSDNYKPTDDTRAPKAEAVESIEQTHSISRMRGEHFAKVDVQVTRQNTVKEAEGYMWWVMSRLTMLS